MQWAKHINTLAIILFSLCKIPAEKVKVSYFAKKILIFDGTQSFNQKFNQKLQSRYSSLKVCLSLKSLLPCSLLWGPSFSPVGISLVFLSHWVGHFLTRVTVFCTSFFFFVKSLLNSLQYCFCFIFWCFCHKACGILNPWPSIRPTCLALEGKIWTYGPPGKSLFSAVLHLLP